MMVDKISQQRRSWNMSRIKGKNSKPELLLRSMLHRSGYRFRIHDSNLPGRPDIVLKKYKAAIFVNGCFWHRHDVCKNAKAPSTNIEFWTNKFNQTVLRDKRIITELGKSGWNVIVVWECELKNNPDAVFKDVCDQILR